MLCFLKRVGPAIVLFVLAPIIAEYLLGDFPATHFSTLPRHLMMYGTGAVFIREISRSTGRGWPTMLPLALAYGLYEEALGDFSLFNRNFLGLHLIDYGFVPSLGTGLPWAIAVLSLHVVWSMATPIALVEALFPERRTAPWLGRTGAVVAGILVTVTMFLRGYLLSRGIHYWPTIPQTVVSVVLIMTLVVAAFVVFPPRDHVRSATAPPGPLWIGIVAFLFGSAFWCLFHYTLDWHAAPSIVSVLGFVSLDVGALAFFLRVSNRIGWSNLHRFAAMAGSLLTYCWYGFVNLDELYGPASFPSHAVLVVLMIVLLVFAWSRATNSPNEDLYSKP